MCDLQLGYGELRLWVCVAVLGYVCAGCLPLFVTAGCVYGVCLYVGSNWGLIVAQFRVAGVGDCACVTACKYIAGVCKTWCEFERV